MYSVKKHSGTVVKDMYPGYLAKTTWLNLIGIGMGPHSNKKIIEYPPRDRVILR
jgi:hypothetical protein